MGETERSWKCHEKIKRLKKFAPQTNTGVPPCKAVTKKNHLKGRCGGVKSWQNQKNIANLPRGKSLLNGAKKERGGKTRPARGLRKTSIDLGRKQRERSIEVSHPTTRRTPYKTKDTVQLRNPQKKIESQKRLGKGTGGKKYKRKQTSHERFPKRKRSVPRQQREKSGKD